MNSPDPSVADIHDGSGEEGIKVAIRMRPLNGKEATAARVWRVLPKYNSVTQTTPTGKPLSERVTGRNFFTFDKTYGEENSTREVYNSIVQGIVKSSMEGLNGTIFAYGQTSSGKTFTMQGNGSIGDCFDTYDGGIVHMAAKDIFSYIADDRQRVFLVRVSFIEIYNEEVRDLLVSGKMDNVLAIREDPQRGVFVNCNENIVTDLENLVGTLFAGEKKRSIASTSMNERSSRSHTIFRITIESRKRTTAPGDDDESVKKSSYDDESTEKIREDLDDDDEVRVSTLNLVDLAGSESVRLTGATGERQKEGGNINKSLLSLSRVIVALGTPNTAHVNYRDSKLTRILQPALSGNSRMAIICCATPSDLYIEETRSTLQFASRAKLVKTRAQINVVMDDRSLIKKLQRELLEAKRASSGLITSAHMRQLENEAANAEKSVRKAEEVIQRLKKAILRGELSDSHYLGVERSIGVRVPHDDQSSCYPIDDRKKKRRRLSDSICTATSSSLIKTPEKCAPTCHKSMTADKKPKRRQNNSPIRLSASQELSILRQCLSRKNSIIRSLQEKMEVACKNSESVSSVHDEPAVMAAEFATSERAWETEKLEFQMNIIQKDAEINALLKQIDMLLKFKEESTQGKEASNSRLLQVEDELNSLQCTVGDLTKKLQLITDEKNELYAHAQHEAALRTEYEQIAKRLGEEVEAMNKEQLRLSYDLAKVNDEKESLCNQNNAIREHVKKLSASIIQIREDLNQEKKNLANDDSKTTTSENLVINTSDEQDQTSFQLQALPTVIENLRSDLAIIRREKQELSTNNNNFKTKLEKQSNELNQLKIDFDDGQMKAAENERYHQDNIETLEARIRDLNTSLVAVEAELDNEKKRRLMEEERSSAFCDQLECVSQERSKLSEDYEEMLSRMSTLSSSLDAMKEELEQKEKLIASAEARSASFEASALDEKATMAHQINLLASERDSLAKEYSALQDQLERQSHELDQLKIDFDDGQTKAAENERYHHDNIETLEARIRDLNTSLVAVEAKFERECTARMDLESRLDDSLCKNVLLISQINEISSTPHEMVILREEINRLQAVIYEKDARCEVEMHKYADATCELNDLKREYLLKDNTSEALLTSLRGQISALTSEVDDLKILLASSNTREMEARAVANAADEELQIKQEELEQALRYGMEKDVALSRAEEKNRSLEHQVSSLGDQDVNELLNDMELLLDEKLQLEAALAKEKEERKEFESQLEYRFGEEQRVLIQEAEIRILQLREELNQTKVNLETTCLERQQARLEVESVLARSQSRSDHVLELEALVNSLKEDVSSSRNACTFLEQELSLMKEESETYKAHVTAARESMKISYDQKVKALRDETEALKSTLFASESKSDTLSQKNKLLQQQLDSCQAQLLDTQEAFSAEKDMVVNKMKDDLASLKLKLSRIDSDYNKSRSECLALKEHLTKLKKEYQTEKVNAVQLVEHELQELREAWTRDRDHMFELSSNLKEKDSEIKSLEDRVMQSNIKITQITEELRTKDNRIKHLEEKKLTKDQVASIENLKAERLQYKSECEELRKRLGTLTSVDVSRKSEEKTLADISALKELNHVLEKKLKKYLTKCTVLEEDQAKLLDSLRSLTPELSSKDLNSAIVELCSIAKKASVYILELDQLKAQVSDLETKLSGSENRISVLSRSEKDLQTKLTYTREELLKLRHTHDDSERSKTEIEHERGRQIKYLEKENLQLHKELKAAKKLLNNAVAERNSVQLALQDPTVEFQSLAACSPIRTILASKDILTNQSPTNSSPSRRKHKTRDDLKSLNQAEKSERRDENTDECKTS